MRVHGIGRQLEFCARNARTFTALEVAAKGERADGYPAVYTAIHLTYLVRGPVSQKAMEDAVRLSKEKYCSVSAMLEKTAKITYTIEHAA